MRMLLATALAASLFATPTFAADIYQLDPQHTNVFWHAGHLGFSTPSGKFTDVKGEVTLDEAKPEYSKLNVTIATGSVLTGIPDFDTHLRSPDFFNVEKFPAATFVSNKVEVTGKNTARVHGDLTLIGVTKPIVLDVTLNKIGEHPFTKKKTAGFSAVTTIKRSDFGMSYGIPNVTDEVKLTIEAEGSVQ